MIEIIDLIGYEVFNVSNTKKERILEYLGVKNHRDKKKINVFIIRFDNGNFSDNRQA